MRVANYIISKTGALIYPTTQININVNARQLATFNNQITLTFYNNIQQISDGRIIPVQPVLSGVTGTVTIKARSDINDLWTDIDGGVIDLSNNNKVFPSGIIQSLQIITTGIAGCEYINVLLDTAV